MVYIDEIAKQAKIEKSYVEKYVFEHNIPYQEKMRGICVDDSYISQILEGIELLASEKEIEELEKQGFTREDIERQRQIERQKEIDKDLELSKILISSGFKFDGHKITKYSGYISGDDVVSILEYTSNLAEGQEKFKQKVCDELVRGRRNALKELKEAAYNLGCNAIIGVDFDYISLASFTTSIIGDIKSNEIVVTANGNAVCIEKDE